MRRNLILFILTLVCSSGAWAQMNFISEVKISAFGKSNLQRDGYIVVDQDLNAHEGGADVYIGYKTTTNPAEAITDLVIMESGYDWRGQWIDVREDKYAYDNWVIPYKRTYYRRCAAYGSDYEDCDLNRHSGGADITLYYTKEHNQEEGRTLLTELTAVGENKSMTGYLYTRHWIYGTDENSTAENDVYGNTNERNGSYKIYLPYKVHTHAYTATFNWADNGHSCSVTTHCACGHSSTGDATITSEVKTPATYRVDGITTYTAKITLNNKKFTDTKDVQDIVMPLDEVKTVVKGMIDDMVAQEKRADMSAFGAEKKALVDAAATREVVWAIWDAFPADLDAAFALVLAQAKADAIAAIQALVSGSTDELVISTANKYIALIGTATTMDDVTRLRSEAESLINRLLTEPDAFEFGFIGTGNPIETQHALEGVKMTYSADGEDMTVTINGAVVTYPLSQVSELTYFQGTPTISLHANQDPDSSTPSFYTTFYSGLEAYTLPEGVKAYTAEISENTVLLTPIEGEILPQGEAVLLYTTEGSEITMVVADGAGVDKSENNKFSGVDVETEQYSSNYMLSYGQDGLAFYKMNPTMKLSANKAFLPASDPAMANVRAFRMVFEDEETGIEAPLPTSPEGEELVTIYNLQGIRLDKLQKGINIVNGKKILVK